MSEEFDDTARTTHADATEQTWQSTPASPRRRRESRRLHRAEVAYAASLILFAVLAVLAHEYAYFAWDLRLARAIQSVDLPGWAALMRWASLFGDGATPWGLTIVTALLFIAWRRRSEGAGVVMSVGGGTLINNLLKLLVERPRPAAELVGFSYASREMSFPSGHVTFYVCFFGFLFFAAYALLSRGSRVRRAALVLLPLPVLLVGLSRIALRAHWPSDVLGAYLLSGVWLVFSVEAYRRWKRRATFHPEEPAVAAVE
jgi:undecaprenyl-diphosphatase